MATAVAVGLAVTSCTGSGSPPPVAASFPSGPVAGLTSSTTDACPGGASRAPLVPDSAAGSDAELDRIVVCLGPVPGRGTVRNESDEVWLVDSPPNLVWTGAPPTAQAVLFRTIIEGIPDRPPGLAVEPGARADFALPATSRIHLTLDPGLQSVWHTQQAIAGPLINRGQDRVVTALSTSSTTRRALLTCGLSGYRVGSRVSRDDAEPQDTLRTALGLGSDVRPCGAALGEVDAEARRSSVAPLVSSEEARVATMAPEWSQGVRRFLRIAATRAGSVR